MEDHDLEARLKELRLRAPSEELDLQVLARERQVPLPGTRWSGRRVPVWVAAVASLAVGGMGFAIGLHVKANPPPPLADTPAPVTVQVIYHSPLTGNLFDFTRPSEHSLPGRMETSIQTTKGT